MSVATIRNKIRFLLGDFAISGEDIFTYDAKLFFTLSEDAISSVDTVYRNNALQSTSGYWDYHEDRNWVEIIGAITSGDTIQVNYTYFPNYSNTELTNYIQAALVFLSINNYYDFKYDSTDDAIYPEMLPGEENILAMIAAVIIRPDNKSIRLPDITISVPDDYPLDKKINMIIARFKADTHGIFDII